jgi:hypothetical protein
MHRVDRLEGEDFAMDIIKSITGLICMPIIGGFIVALIAIAMKAIAHPNSIIGQLL